MSDRTPPGMPTPKAEASRPAKIVMWCSLGILAALVIFIGINSMATGSGEDDPYDSNNKFEAIAQCEARIEPLLKAPATAEFKTSASGSGTWSVTGTVDSENGFGATVRSDFECTVVMNSDNTATTTVEHLTQR